MQRYHRHKLTRLASAWALLGGAAILLLSACGSSDKPQAVTPLQPVVREKVANDPTARMAHAVTIGKSNVPVDLKYEILSRPIIDTPVEIELALVPTVGADSMSVSFAPSPGLTLSTDAAAKIDVVKAGQVERVRFSAQAKEETVFYVTVTATVYTAGTSSARNFAIPIIMSASAQAAAPAVATAPAPGAKKS